MTSRLARWRRQVLLITVLSIFAAAAAHWWWVSRTAGPAKNLILISIDTLRADHLGCYGYRRPTSPTLDELAAHGVLFTDVTAAAPWTLPSHAAMLTGLYPHHNGIKDYGTRLDDKIPTLASVLADAGFHTMAIVNHPFLQPQFGLNRGFQQFDYIPEWSAEKRATVDSGPAITNEAIEWLSHVEQRPFFLFLHYYDVHSDYAPQPEFRRLFADGYDGPVDGTSGQLLKIRAAAIRLGPKDVQHLVDLYDGEIRQLDTQLSRVLRFLDEHHYTENTLVAVTADHGEEFMEHGGVLHGRTCYQEVLAVPLFMRGPGVPRGVRVTQPVSLVDLMPTVLSLMAAPLPERRDGISLRPYWERPAGPFPDRVAFAEAFLSRQSAALADFLRTPPAGAEPGNVQPGTTGMVRSGADKFCLNPLSQRNELYDLRTDPGEQVDLSAREPDRAQRLRGLLEGFVQHAVVPGASVTLSQEQLERLRQLGYAP